MTTPKGATCLRDDRDAEAAARSCADAFPEIAVRAVHRAPAGLPQGRAGDARTVEFTDLGIPRLGLNGGPASRRSEASSFRVATGDQEEADRCRDAIVGNGGEASARGWCGDRWGVSRRVTPRVPTGAPATGREEARRAVEAMTTTGRTDMAALGTARRGRRRREMALGGRGAGNGGWRTGRRAGMKRGPGHRSQGARPGRPATRGDDHQHGPCRGRDGSAPGGAGPAASAAAPARGGPTATGIDGLDAVLGGGLPAGRPTPIRGAAGCAKTLLGLSVLVPSATGMDELGVPMGFEESAGAASLGFDLEGPAASRRIVVDHLRAERGEIEEAGEHDPEGLFVRLGHAIGTVGARRVMLDAPEALFAGLGAGIGALLRPGGSFRGPSVLVGGATGLGKSILGARFADAACRRGERAATFALEEGPDRIVRDMESVGVHSRTGLPRIEAARPSPCGLEMHLTPMNRPVGRFDPAVMVPIPAFPGAEDGGPRDAPAHGGPAQGARRLGDVRQPVRAGRRARGARAVLAHGHLDRPSAPGRQRRAQPDAPRPHVARHGPSEPGPPVRDHRRWRAAGRAPCRVGWRADGDGPPDAGCGGACGRAPAAAGGRGAAARGATAERRVVEVRASLEAEGMEVRMPTGQVEWREVRLRGDRAAQAASRGAGG